jgi:septal ring factor EnvC (AmiA/AmiB activator)
MADEPTTPRGGEPADAGNKDQPRTFDQAAVDRIVAERLAKEKGKYSDYDQLKSDAAELKKLKEADQSELTKAQTRISELEQQHNGTTTEAQELRVEVAVLKAATKAGITDPDVAARLLDRSKIDFDDSGQPTNMPKLLEDLGKEHPFLLDQARHPTSMDGGAREPVAGGADMNTLLRRAAGRA